VSGRGDREARREQRLREEEQAGAVDRRQKLIKLASAAAFLALATVAVLIVVSQSQNAGGDTELEGVTEVREALAGVPQDGMALGKAGARTTVLEFADLQCPVCKGYSEEVLPRVIERQVRSGEAKIDFRNFTIIGPASTPAGAAAIAAGEQGRGWDFVELFYRNQGTEGTDYVTDEFLTAIARGAGVPDIGRWSRDRKSRHVLHEVAASTEQAESLGFTGTPSFALEGPGTAGLEALGTPSSAESLESAIAGAGAS
jgi:protein-disulfide isomerase